MRAIDLNLITEVKRYGYRKALVFDTFMVIDRYSDAGKEFEDLLVKKSDGYSDNHTCYELCRLKGPSVYVMCTDKEILIGTDIEFR